MIFEAHFKKFRELTIGHDASIVTPIGTKPLVYADWIASGRLYLPIEEQLHKNIGPFVANTHSESSDTGAIMTNIYKRSHQIIKQHVNASKDDIIITADQGMTGVVNKLQRILGIRIPEQALKHHHILPEQRPVVFVTHMEHHSNHTSWLETIADVVVIPPTNDLLVNPESLRQEISKYSDRSLKIGAFSACSNVTGIEVPYHELAQIMHENGGLCFVDFAASAPYVKIDMHPNNPLMALDAVYFSPHKFLGGPGSSGVLIFNKSIYHNAAPDNSGGGTVDWTNMWGKYRYIEDIETREDGGTPGFLQSIKAALAIKLKEEMDVEKIRLREQEMVDKVLTEFRKIPGMNILADNVSERLGAISFYLDDVHFNLVVRLLNDFYGIQVRGGCSCAGTYGHYLLHVDYYTSNKITSKINKGDWSEKPGWVRLSLHPTMSETEVEYIINAVKHIGNHWQELSANYQYIATKNEYQHITQTQKSPADYDSWFCI